MSTPTESQTELPRLIHLKEKKYFLHRILRRIQWLRKKQENNPNEWEKKELEAFIWAYDELSELLLREEKMWDHARTKLKASE